MNGGPPDALERLLEDPRLWRGSSARQDGHRVSSGHAGLDQALGGGWPRGVVCELALAEHGCGELALLLPVLHQLGGTAAWIAPPHVPYPPALAAAGVAVPDLLLIEPATPAQAQWAGEQVLRSRACAAVLLWLPSAGAQAVRRLQLAAEDSGAFVALLLPAAGSPASSPAALRLQLAAAERGIAVSVRKRRGGWPSSPLIVEYPHGVVAGPVSAGVGTGGAAGH